jgi:hypothetical protein
MLVLMVDKGDDENLRDLNNDMITFSICVSHVDLYGSVVGLHIMKEHLDYWELRKSTIVH